MGLMSNHSIAVKEACRKGFKIPFAYGESIISSNTAAVAVAVAATTTTNNA